MKIIAPELYQWDSGRRLLLDEHCSWVDYRINGLPGCLRVPCELTEGGYQARIPNIVLTRYGQMTVYCVQVDDQGHRTEHRFDAFIKGREKPADYVFTEEDYYSWEQLRQEVLEEGRQDVAQAIDIRVQHMEELEAAAGASAKAAAGSASAASMSAGAAADAKAAAESAKGRAESSALSASASLSNTISFKQLAEKARDTAVAAKDEALAAKGAALTAQAAAESAKGASEAAQTKAETAQVLAGQAASNANTAKAGAEAAQGKAETAQSKAEQAAAAAGTAKTGAETAQGKAQAAQTAAENTLAQVGKQTAAGVQTLQDTASALDAALGDKYPLVPEIQGQLDTLAENVDTKADKKATDVRLTNLEAAASGVLYREETNSTPGDKTVPAGALPYASLDVLGGMSRKGKNLLDVTRLVKESAELTVGPGGRTITVSTSNPRGKASMLVPELAGKRVAIVVDRITQTVTAPVYVGLVIQLASGSYQYKSLGTDLATSVFEIPQDAKLVRFDINANDSANTLSTPNVLTIAGLRIVAQNTDPFEPYTPSLIPAAVDSVVSVGRNILNLDDYHQWFASDGETARMDSYRSYIVPCRSGDTIYFDGDLSNINSQAVRVSVFEQRPDIGAYGKRLNSNINRDNLSITIPSGAYRYALLMFGLIDINADVTKEKWIATVNSPINQYTPYRSETLSIPESIRNACPDYGIGVSADCCNYIDFVEKKYHRRCKRISVTSVTGISSNSDGSVRAYVNYPNTVIGRISMIASGFAANQDITYDDRARLKAGECFAWMTSVSGSSQNPKGTMFFVFPAGTSKDDAENALNTSDVIIECEEEVIDLPDLPGNILPVEAGGTIRCHYPVLDDGYQISVPNTVTFDISTKEAISNA